MHVCVHVMCVCVCVVCACVSVHVHALRSPSQSGWSTIASYLKDSPSHSHWKKPHSESPTETELQ